MPLGLRSLPGGGGALEVGGAERVHVTTDAASPLEVLAGGSMRKVVESGENANGTWVRFADGTQMCWNHSAVPFGSGDGTWTYPMAFSATPYTNAIGRRSDDSGSYITNKEVPGLTSVIFTRFVNSVTISAFAIGRWY